MKKQQFNIVKKQETVQILGGITDPNLDPDAGYVAPVEDPVPTDTPNDDTTKPRSKRNS